MRIQNNITAMNTHRQYTINNDNVAKAAEKLSSGYRINRAADDAAGLAISEKMRSQIRGLNMATKNSQDAISLVQTAEGALQETHSMLQRMNELAVQAATGTNQEFDRTQAAKEFEQLKREINDVAEQTTFNNMKILDGSLSYNGYVRSAATAGVTNTVSEKENTNPAGVVVGKTTQYQPPKGEAAATVAGLTIDKNDFAIAIQTAKAGAGADASAKFEISLATVDASGNPDTPVKLTIQKTDFGAATTEKVGDWLVGQHAVTGDDGEDYTVEIDSDGNVKVTADEKQTTSFATTAGGATATLTLTDGGSNTGTNADAAWASTSPAGQTAAGTITNGSTATAAATAESTRIAINADQLKAGDKITIGENTFEVIEQGGSVTAGSGNTALQLDADGKISDATVINAITGATYTTPALTVSQVTGSTNLLEIKQTQAAPSSDTANYVNTRDAIEWDPKTEVEDKIYTNTIEFDTAKMKDGDKFTIDLGDGVKGEYTYNEKEVLGAIKGTEQTAAEYVAEKMKDSLLDHGADRTAVSAKGNAIIITGAKVENDKIALETDATKDLQTSSTDYPTNAIRIQVGALENEQLAVSINSMNTAGLGLDNSGLETQKSAGEAITAVRAAINEVSDLRATLGAMQNRLDHKIANLKVSSENLSAAESRIRDVDMASEMTNFTKNNILSQAATAMLAQANALPQNVLSLLG